MINSPMILIAEDSPLNMMLIVSMVNQLIPEAEVIEVSNGRQAVDVVERIVVDLIFMDIQMPEMDGMQATRMIRIQEAASGIERPVPIVAVTAFTLNREKERCLQAGMNDFLSKPIVIKSINEILVKYLKSSRKINGHAGHSVNDCVDFGNSHFDLAALVGRTAVDEGVLKELARNAATELSHHLQSLSIAITQNKRAEIDNITHAIKGIALNISFNSLAQMARKMEVMVEDDPDQINLQFHLMRDEVEAIQKFVAIQ